MISLYAVYLWLGGGIVLFIITVLLIVVFLSKAKKYDPGKSVKTTKRP